MHACQKKKELISGTGILPSFVKMLLHGGTGAGHLVLLRAPVARVIDLNVLFHEIERTKKHVLNLLFIVVRVDVRPLFLEQL